MCYNVTLKKVSKEAKGKDREPYKGRPRDTSRRMDRKIRVYDFLDSIGIEYKRIGHRHVDTMKACHEIDAVLETLVCKDLYLCNRQRTNFYLLIMPGEKPFKTKKLSGQIRAVRLSFSGPEKMLEYLDIKPGAVSFMGLIYDKDNHVRLLVDGDALQWESLGCHPCVNT